MSRRCNPDQIEAAIAEAIAFLRSESERIDHGTLRVEVKLAGPRAPMVELSTLRRRRVDSQRAAVESDITEG